MEGWGYELGVPAVVILGYSAMTLVLFLVSYILPPSSTVQRHSSFFARTLASFAALFICATYGVFASIILKIAGLGGLSQWTAGRAFKWTMWLFTGVLFEVVEGEEYLLERPAVFVGNHQSYVQQYSPLLDEYN
jgi:lysophosphatidate acyltransferase